MAGPYSLADTKDRETIVSYSVRILCDSTFDGNRLTTFEITFPRFILAEVNTHKILSRSTASSRAIPVERRLEQIVRDPFIPSVFGKNRPGMQHDEELEPEASDEARRLWLDASISATAYARKLATLGLHKQYANRLVEPFAWVTAVISGTEWENHFALRCHEDSQPEYQYVATLMRDLYRVTAPEILKEGEWHLPYVDKFGEPRLTGEAGLEAAFGSAGCCARVSVRTFDGTISQAENVRLAKRIISHGHFSPAEHPACAGVRRDNPAAFQSLVDGSLWAGNYRGFTQLRKMLSNENNFEKV